MAKKKLFEMLTLSYKKQNKIKNNEKKKVFHCISLFIDHSVAVDATKTCCNVVIICLNHTLE